MPQNPSSPLSAIREATSLYRAVCEITREQEHALRSADLRRFTALLSRKADLVGRAQELVTSARGSLPPDPAAGPLGPALAELKAVVRELVEAEERCRALLPGPAPAPRAVALGAYGAKPRK